ncbi:MAG: hypothetical protein GF353_20465 [Candidatus Lokiarchaeota archaeon]|nr:hypothetical protein [Candidatus Lokiarchaeota archaeon]
MSVKKRTSPIQETDKVIKDFKKDFEGFYLGDHMKLEIIIDDLFESMNNDKISKDTLYRQLSLNFLNKIIFMIKEDKLNHRDFFLEALSTHKFWQPLTKMILAKRIEELKGCKVLKKGRKYYIADFKKTYLGKIIVDKLDYSRRSVLQEDEYEKLTRTIKKLNYEIPLVINPTETEKFFQE